MELSTVKIFILDDDDFFLHTLKTVLLHEGYTDIKLLRKSEELFSKLDQKPDIIILDHFLDGELGLDVLIKLESLTDKIKVIYMSSQESVSIVLKSIQEGAFTYLEKNSENMKNIARVIETILDEQTGNDQA